MISPSFLNQPKSLVSILHTKPFWPPLNRKTVLVLTFRAQFSKTQKLSGIMSEWMEWVDRPPGDGDFRCLLWPSALLPLLVLLLLLISSSPSSTLLVFSCHDGLLLLGGTQKRVPADGRGRSAGRRRDSHSSHRAENHRIKTDQTQSPEKATN